jgi:hypothetical protein
VYIGSDSSILFSLTLCPNPRIPDRGFWPWFRCYELPTKQSKQGLSPTQNFYQYSFYVHFYSSDHLQASSAFSIDPWLIPTLTRSWSWPSSSYWRIERKIQQLAILEAPMLSLPQKLVPFLCLSPLQLPSQASSISFPCTVTNLLPKIINPVAFIQKVDGELNS